MRLTKLVVAALGLIIAAVAGYFLFTAWVDIRGLMMVANANRSAEFASPWPRVWWSSGLALMAGLTLGIAIGLPLSLRRDKAVEHGLRRNRVAADQTRDEMHESVAEKHPSN